MPIVFERKSVGKKLHMTEYAEEETEARGNNKNELCQTNEKTEIQKW